MKRKKPNRKDFENAIIQLDYKVSNLTGYINGIAEVLNDYIEYGGKAKQFFQSLEKSIEENKKELLKEDAK